MKHTLARVGEVGRLPHLPRRWLVEVGQETHCSLLQVAPLKVPAWPLQIFLAPPALKQTMSICLAGIEANETVEVIVIEATPCTLSDNKFYAISLMAFPHKMEILNT